MNSCLALKPIQVLETELLHVGQYVPLAPLAHNDEMAALLESEGHSQIGVGEYKTNIRWRAS